ncbi:electron carrier/ protein disulfide oxidoreductase [Anaeramoeba flamelloides]|uniref:Electron carrier/ protein disulfide oxidoreductase n=1 Tax=Anaeramoeba flamelloides TaxID=1746091 RepID=A0ABQ8YB11_9EUKA|nr:electron carrier/ protein disulfide oxidoreductase [Anaeramoeba flamelloides]
MSKKHSLQTVDSSHHNSGNDESRSFEEKQKKKNKTKNKKKEKEKSPSSKHKNKKKKKKGLLNKFKSRRENKKSRKQQLKAKKLEEKQKKKNKKKNSPKKGKENKEKLTKTNKESKKEAPNKDQNENVDSNKEINKPKNTEKHKHKNKRKEKQKQKEKRKENEKEMKKKRKEKKEKESEDQNLEQENNKEKEKNKGKEKEKEKNKEKEKEKEKNKEKEKEKEKNKEKEKEKEKNKEKEKEKDRKKEKGKEKENLKTKQKEEPKKESQKGSEPEDDENWTEITTKPTINPNKYKKNEQDLKKKSTTNNNNNEGDNEKDNDKDNNNKNNNINDNNNKDDHNGGDDDKDEKNDTEPSYKIDTRSRPRTRSRSRSRSRSKSSPRSRPTKSTPKPKSSPNKKPNHKSESDSNASVSDEFDSDEISETIQKKKKIKQKFLKEIEDLNLEEIKLAIKKLKFENNQLENQNMRGNLDLKLSQIQKRNRDKMSENEKMERKLEALKKKEEEWSQIIQEEESKGNKLITDGDLEELDLKIKQLQFEETKIDKENVRGNLQMKIRGANDRLRKKTQEVDKMDHQIIETEKMIKSITLDLQEEEEFDLEKKEKELEDLENELKGYQKKIRVLEFEKKNFQKKLDSLVSYSGKDRLINLKYQLSNKIRENNKLNNEIEDLKMQLKLEKRQQQNESNSNNGNDKSDSNVENDETQGRGKGNSNSKHGKNNNNNNNELFMFSDQKSSDLEDLFINESGTNQKMLKFQSENLMNTFSDVNAFFIDSMEKLSRRSITINNGGRLDSIETLNGLLQIPIGVEYFKEFLSQQLSQESILFWIEVDLFTRSRIEENLIEFSIGIYNKFIKENSLFEIEINHQTLKAIEGDIKNENYSFDMFDDAKEEIYRHLEKNFFPKFLKSDLFLEFQSKYKTDKNFLRIKDLKTGKIVANEKDNSALNIIYSRLSQIKDRNPLIISQKLIKSLIDMLHAHYSVSTEQIDCELVFQSIPFRRFLVATSELQNIDHSDIVNFNHLQKLSFWLNIYNTLILHGAIVNQIPTDKVSLLKFLQENKYKIGKYCFSLYDIKYGILLGNPNKKLKINNKYLLEKEITDSVKLLQKDKRVVFALVSLTSQSPIIKTYYPESINTELEETTKIFLSKNISIDKKNSKILLPLEIYTYSNLFGETIYQILEYVSQFLSKEDQSILLNEYNGYSVKYSRYKYFPVIEFDSNNQIL